MYIVAYKIKWSVLAFRMNIVLSSFGLGFIRTVSLPIATPGLPVNVEGLAGLFYNLFELLLPVHINMP